MRNVTSLLFLVIVFSSRTCVSKVYTKCGLTQELLNQNFPRSFIGNWVCLIESESAKNTSKKINKANGSQALGLFQIESKSWCTFNRPGGKCNMKCENLLDENVNDDSKCAKKIHGEVGFRGWEGWQRSCYGRTLPMPKC